MTTGRRRDWLLVVGLVVLAGVLRTPGMADRPMWYDEAVQHRIASQETMADVLALQATRDRFPPGHSVLMWATGATGGNVPARLPGWIAGLLVPVLAYLAGRAWAGRASGLVLALLCTVSPAWVFYAREARPYGVVLALVLLLLWTGAEHVRRRGRGTTVPLALACVLCVFWQYAAAVTVAAVLLAIPAWAKVEGRWSPEMMRGWLAAGTAATVAVVAVTIGWMVPQYLLQGGGGDPWFDRFLYVEADDGSVPAFVVAHAGDMLQFLVVSDGRPWTIVGLAAVLVALVPGIAWCLRRGRGRVLLGVAAGLVAFFAAAAVLHLHPFGGSRHMLPITPPVMLVAAAGATRAGVVGRRWARGGLVVTLFVMVALGLPALGGLHHQDVPSAVRAAQARARPGDTAVIELALVETVDLGHTPDFPVPAARVVSRVRDMFRQVALDRVRAGGRTWILAQDHLRVPEYMEETAGADVRRVLWVRRRGVDLLLYESRPGNGSGGR